MADRVSRISSKAIAKATGKTWREWTVVLDLADAVQWEHKSLIDFLADTYRISPWWCQTIAIQYERVHRQRVIGQTATAGFEMGVQRTIARTQGQLWDVLTSIRGIALWLGEPVAGTLTAGSDYTTASRITGVFRVVNPPHHLRLTWQLAGWTRASTLQLRLVPVTGEKTSLRFHQEQLASEAIRLQMRRHWQEVIETIAQEALKICDP